MSTRIGIATVALVVLPDVFATDPDWLARFQEWFAPVRTCVSRLTSCRS